MGYIRNTCMVVYGPDEKVVIKYHEKAITLFKGISEGNIYFSRKLSSLISPVIPVVVNTGASFFIGVDGSKEGWSESDLYDRAVREFIDSIDPIDALDWGYIVLGGDDKIFNVIDSPEKNHSFSRRRV